MSLWFNQTCIIFVEGTVDVHQPFLNQIFQKYMLFGQNKKGLQCFKDCSFSVSLSCVGKIAFISCFIGVRPEPKVKMVVNNPPQKAKVFEKEID